MKTHKNRTNPENIAALVHFLAAKKYGYTGTQRDLLALFEIGPNFGVVFSRSKYFENKGNKKSPTWAIADDVDRSKLDLAAKFLFEDYKEHLKAIGESRAAKVEAQGATAKFVIPILPAVASLFDNKPDPGLTGYQAEAVLELLIKIDQKLDLLMTEKTNS